MSDLHRECVAIGRRPALILVDLINGFTDPDCPLGSDCPEVIEANRQLLQQMRARRLPVVFTTVVYYSGDQASVFRQRLPALNCLQPGSRWIEVDARLAPAVGETVIEKQWASGFFKTDLAARLEQLAVDSLIVTGLTTSGCVRATALDGLQYNYPVFVPEEAVGDRNPAAHAANLFDLQAKYAEVCSVAELIDQLP